MPAAPGANGRGSRSEPPTAFGGRVPIADNSVWQRTERLPPAIEADWLSALTANQIATCAVVKLEVLYSARSAAEFEELQEELDALRDSPINRSVCRSALWAIREIKQSSEPRRIAA